MAKFLPRKKLLKFKSKIIETKYITDNTKHLIISIPEEFDFYSGQFISLIFYINGEEIRRPYSIASNPKPYELDLCIKILANGRISPIIDSLKIGDEIEAMGPMGNFYIFEEYLNKNLILISTGTGVAPFRSIVNYLLENNFKNKLKLITGYRHKKDILYEEEFRNLEEKNKNFSYHRILSQYGEENERGYVQKLINNNLDSNAHYYICGLKEMINSVKDFLIEKGISKDNILFEKYD